MPELRTIDHIEFNPTVGSQAIINAHIANQNNPHNVRPEQLPYIPGVGSLLTANNVNEAVNQLEEFIFPGGETISGITQEIEDNDELLPTSGAVFRALQEIIDAGTIIFSCMLTIIENQTNNYIYDLTEGKADEYDLIGDNNITLGVSEEEFLSDEKIFIFLNGIELDKYTEVEWVSTTTFKIYISVEPEDTITVRRFE